MTPWAKVPRAILKDRRLKPLDLRVLIALLSYADPRQPEKQVWASPRTIAKDVGLKDSRGSIDAVRQAIHRLEELGYLEITSKKFAKYRVSLQPLLAGSYKSYDPETSEVIQIVCARSYKSYESSEQTTEPTTCIKNKPPAEPEVRSPINISAEGKEALKILRAVGVSKEAAADGLKTLKVKGFDKFRRLQVAEDFSKRARAKPLSAPNAAWVGYAGKTIARAEAEKPKQPASFSQKQNAKETLRSLTRGVEAPGKGGFLGDMIEDGATPAEIEELIARGIQPPGWSEDKFHNARRQFISNKAAKTIH
jgi:hypothetical protein